MAGRQPGRDSVSDDDALFWFVMAVCLLGAAMFVLFALWPALFGPLPY